MNLNDLKAQKLVIVGSLALVPNALAGRWICTFTDGQ
jgi:hypothetical protein